MLFTLLACLTPPAPTEAKAPAEPVALVVPVEAPPAEATPPKALPDYPTLRSQLQERRRALAARYAAAPESGRAAVLAEARAALVEGLTTELFPAWDGTPWAFEGIAASPGEEPIACGYFVSTTLQHLGYSLNRYKLAQQAAADIAASLIGPASLRWYRDDQAGALAEVAARPSVWVVGLDFHVGYLWNDGQALQFCHSNYIGAVGVMCEPAATSDALSASRVHVLGELFTEEQARVWLTGKELEILRGTRPPG